MTQTITIDAAKGREIAATVADAIRRAFDKRIGGCEGDDAAGALIEAASPVVDAAMQALADALVPTIYKRPEPIYGGVAWSPAREAEARAHYEGWDGQPGYVPWVPGGNSDKQEEARRIVVKRVLAAAPEVRP